MILHIIAETVRIPIKHQTSNIKHQTSNIKHQTSNIKHQTSNIKHQTSNIKPNRTPRDRERENYSNQNTMLNNIWHTVVGGDDDGHSSKKHYTSVLSDEDTANLTENDDEAADKLLTQFPTYGTNPNNAPALEQEDGDRGKDLFEEERSAPILLFGNNNPRFAKKSMPSNPIVSNDSDDYWEDQDEKDLWKASPGTTSGGHKNQSEHQNDRDKLANNNMYNNRTMKISSASKSNSESMKRHDSSFYEWDDHQRREWVDGRQVPTTGANNNAGTAAGYLMSSRTPFSSSSPNPSKDGPGATNGKNTSGTAGKSPSSSLDTESNTVPTATAATSMKSFSFLKQKSQSDDREHWMPDQLCKHCYGCDAQFTVFRRRHHCRVCGQVFCSTCSAYFVELPPDCTLEDVEGKTIRACKICFENSPLPLLEEQVPQAPGSTANDRESGSSPSKDGKAAGNGATGGSGAPPTHKRSSSNPTSSRTVVASPLPPTHKRDSSLNNEYPLPKGNVNKGSTGNIKEKASSPPTTKSTISNNLLLLPASTDISSSLSSNRHKLLPQGSSVQTTLEQQLKGKNNSVISTLSKRQSEKQNEKQGKMQNPFDRLAQHLEETQQKQQKEGEAVNGSSFGTAESEKTFTAKPGLAGRIAQRLSNNSSPVPNVQNGEDSNAAAADGVDLGIDALQEEMAIELQLSSSTTPKMTFSRDAEETAAAAAKKPQQAAHCNHLGLLAASHLEKLGKQLLKTEAPLLFQEHPRLQKQWLNKLMTLATRCCATVNPNVKQGDLLDIRPYCKLKTIPGGSYKDCAYMSGVVFRKNVSHKRMAREIENPRIMLLSGGIEFTRTENRIASLDTLMEQEEKYMEILVVKILRHKPDLLLVGKSVSRKALELLLKARVVLIQQVKSTLMSRISRETGATIISSTDHVMNTFGENVLGKCKRFRLVTFRDNEKWVDQNSQAPQKGTRNRFLTTKPKVIQDLLKDTKLSNQDRQAALAANVLGQSVLDGSEAVKKGLAKRGVAQTFVMLEGCPKDLGCTVVLRGASRAALKQVKRILRFLIYVAYNLRLETSYLKERCAKLPDSYKVLQENLFSSSLCVDYGNPPNGRKVRPWNGRSNEPSQRSISGQVTAFDHQSILITSVWMADKTQCCPAEVKGICCYSLQDVSLGQFLRDSCFNLSLKCQNSTCKKSVLDHSLSFIHNDGLINITVEQMDDPLPPPPQSKKSRGNDESDDAIATWTYCTNCARVVTPLVYISEDTWKYSFGKFLECSFYNRDAQMNSPDHGCSCQMQSAATLYFGCGRLAARFTYESVKSFGVFVRRHLPIDDSFHRIEARHHLEQIATASAELFVAFDKHIEKVSREARSLFGSAANRPEHLQTVLAELGTIGNEVDHAAKTLQEKIASVSEKLGRSLSHGTALSVNEALFRFPWYARRYLFMLTSAWNERISAVGEAITAMKKLAASAPSGGQRGDIVPNIVGDGGAGDALIESMRRLRHLHDLYSQYHATDTMTALPLIPGSERTFPRHDSRELHDDDFDDAEFATDGIDADVLASRRRLADHDTELTRGRPRKSLGTPAQQHVVEQDTKMRRGREPSPVPSMSRNKAINTPGGAVKSALHRFFNRVGRETDPYMVNLGLFKEGRPRLEVGVGGIIVPVFDEQPSTVIAYSLSSAEYAKQFQQFSKAEGTPDGDIPDASMHSTGQDSSAGSALPRPMHRRQSSTTSNASSSVAASGEKKDIERRMLVRNKSHIKHTFRDYDEKGQQTCKFVCTAYWATQFHAVRQAFLTPKDQFSSSSSASSQASSHVSRNLDVEKCFIQSLSSSQPWAASGGKSGASFARTVDERFVIKYISRTELQMFLDCAPAYFEYLSKAFFHGLPTVLCKIVGVYQIGSHDRVTGKRTMEQVAVMQNIFYGKKISQVFDLKGSLRGRFAKDKVAATEVVTGEDLSRNLSDSELSNRQYDDQNSSGDDAENEVEVQLRDRAYEPTTLVSTLLDGDFLEFTAGRPLPLTDRAKAVFHMSVLNDTLFLSIINVLDYSILVGIDEERMELVVGIIDFMRQYDILKQMERVGKSLPMVVGSEAPTIIQPPLYKARFTNAMERYFMTVPNKWTVI